MWYIKRCLLLLMLLVKGATLAGEAWPDNAAIVLSQSSTSLYAFTDVNVVPLDTERILWHQTVIIANQHIVAIRPVDQIAVPAAATRIVGTGKFLLPGLADMHIHLRKEYYLLLLLANGVTLTRNMDGRPIHLTWRAQIAAGARLGPLIYTTGPILDELPCNLPDPRPLSTLAGARQLVAAQTALGYDYLKVHDGLSGSSYQNLMAAACEYQMPVVGHVPNGLSILDVIAAGQRSIEHLDGYFNFYDDQLPTLTLALVNHGVWSTPTLTCYQSLHPTGQQPAGLQATMLAALPDIIVEFPTMPADFTEKGYAYTSINALQRKLMTTLQTAGAPPSSGDRCTFPVYHPWLCGASRVAKSGRGRIDALCCSADCHLQCRLFCQATGRFRNSGGWEASRPALAQRRSFGGYS